MRSDDPIWFFQRLGNYIERPEAVIWNDKKFSYQWLINAIDTWTVLLAEYDLSTGSIVSFVSDFSPHTTALFLALLKQNHIIVPLSHSLTNKEVQERITLTGVEYMVRFCADGTGVVTKIDSKGERNDLLEGLRQGNRPGLVVFSSGSSGKTKAILHDMTKLLRKYKRRRHTVRAITFLLLDHLGGINTLLYILSNGGTAITVRDRDPTTICEVIEKHGVELLPTSPSFLNLLLLSEVYRSHDLNSLKMITYGTEPMPESTLKKVACEFRNVTLIQTYGLSEIGVLRTKSRGNASKWFRAGGEGINLKIVNGELLIKAESSMVGYLNLPSPFDEKGYFHTGDLVECDGEYITILGRTTDVISVGGQKVFPAEVESTILTMPEVDDVTVYGEENILTGEVVVARVSTSRNMSSREMKKRIRAVCGEVLSSYKIPAKVIIDRTVEYSSRFKKVRKPNKAAGDES